MTLHRLTHLSRLGLVLGLLAAAALAGAGAALVAIRDASAGNERSQSAHAVLALQLELDAGVSRLIQQHLEMLVFGRESARDADADEQLAAIARTAKAIRRGIEAEIELVGAEEEAEELGELVAIEADIRALHAAFHDLLEAVPPPGAEALRARAQGLLEGELAARLRERIRVAVAHEREEVAETNAEVAARARTLRTVVLAIVALSLLVALGGYARLRGDLVRPFAELLAGARALAAGRFHSRIPVAGPTDFAELAHTFNDMAAEIELHDQEMLAVRAGLEQAVSTRTRDLQAALTDLAEADRHRRNLLADVSHELRTPLTIVRGEADVVLRDPEAGATSLREALSRIRDASTHAAQIVDDLLFMARTEEGVPRLELRTVDLASIVAHKVDLARSLAGPGCRLTFATDFERAPARADARRFRQALLVLLDNAILYGGGEVAVTLDHTADGWRVTVTDNGPGMSAQEIAETFERFRRSGAGELGRRDGSGLGLPIARAIMEAHGGSLTLERAEPRGTRATLCLPNRPPRRTTLPE